MPRRPSSRLSELLRTLMVALAALLLALGPVAVRPAAPSEEDVAASERSERSAEAELGEGQPLHQPRQQRLGGQTISSTFAGLTRSPQATPRRVPPPRGAPPCAPSPLRC